MKKLAAWVLVICLLFALAACGEQTKPAEEAAETIAQEPGDAEKEPAGAAQEKAAQPATEQNPEAEAQTEEPVEEPVEEPAEEPAKAAEPYGDSDGVIDRDKVVALFRWMDSMPSDFMFALTFDEIGEAVGKAGHDEQNGDGSTHAASWSDGGSTILLVTFRNKDDAWTCSAVSFSGFSRDEAAEADISAFPAVGSSAPAGSSPVVSVTSEGEDHWTGFKFAVTADVPTRQWFPIVKSGEVRYYCAPNEARADYSDAYITVSFKESEEKINSYQDKFTDLVELDGRTIGGIDMVCRSYQYIGMKWVEFYGELREGVWVSVMTTGVDLTAGTEADALIQSLTFAVE